MENDIEQAAHLKIKLEEYIEKNDELKRRLRELESRIDEMTEEIVLLKIERNRYKTEAAHSSENYISAIEIARELARRLGGADELKIAEKFLKDKKAEKAAQKKKDVEVKNATPAKRKVLNGEKYSKSGKRILKPRV